MEWWMISVDEVVEEKSGRVRREGIKSIVDKVSEGSECE